MAWDPEPGFHAAVTARRANDKPVALYSMVTYHGPRRKLLRRKVRAVWKSDEVKIEWKIGSKQYMAASMRLLEEAEDVAEEMTKEDLIR